jgi:DNA replication protein DnaC
VTADPGWYEEHARQVDARLAAVFPAEFADATATDPGVVAWCDEQVASANMAGPGGPWALVLVGPTGAGKTWQAYGAIRRVCLRTRLAHRAASLPDLLDGLRPGPDDRVTFDDYARAGLLLVDDLGSHKTTEWAEMTLDRLVNHRWAHRLATIFTTNLMVAPDPGEQFPGPTLKSELSARVYSRLAASRVVVLDGDDRRMPGDGDG